ncbi:hypothetical protein F7F78_18310 [Escherichia coli]|nr:hypothetical protein F7F78_18310 [Escherichia coli]
MLPSETMIWQPEFTDKTLSRKPGAVQTFQFHDCNAKHFTCKYQDVLINFDGQQKRTISVYLEDTPRAVGIIALMEPDTADKYRQQAMEIMLSAKNTVK